jgi:hypothetical protein
MAGFDDYKIDAADTGEEYSGLDMVGFVPTGEYEGDATAHLQQYDKLVKELVKAKLNGFINAVKAATAAALIGFAPGASGMTSANVNAAILEAFGNIINDLTTGGATKFLSAEQGKNLYTYLSGGWIPVTGEWTRASANSFNVPSGAADKYKRGYGVRYKQGGDYKYMSIIADPADELLTVSGGSDHTIAVADITDIAYAIDPHGAIGFPSKFSLTVPTYTTTGTAFTNQPINKTAFVTFYGDYFHITGQLQCHPTSGGTGAFEGPFTPGELPTISTPNSGSAIKVTGTFVSGYAMIEYGTRTIKIAKYDGAAIATNSEYVYFDVACRY